MPTSRTGKQTGFTLLELLLAVTLGAVISSAVYASYSTALDANRRISRTAIELQSSRFFVERLRSDLKNLVIDGSVPSSALSGDSQSLTLQHAPPQGLPGTVVYAQRQSANGGHIRRSLLKPDNESQTIEDGSVVLRQVQTLSFRYLIDGRWMTNTTDTLPTAVEFNVQLDGRQLTVVISLEVEPWSD